MDTLACGGAAPGYGSICLLATHGTQNIRPDRPSGRSVGTSTTGENLAANQGLHQTGQIFFVSFLARGGRLVSPSFGLTRAQATDLGERQTSERGAFGVADPAVAGSATQDYRGEPPSGTPPERVRVALVPGSGSVTERDLYQLLRRRLLVVCTIVACLFFVVVSGSLVRSVIRSDP